MSVRSCAIAASTICIVLALSSFVGCGGESSAVKTEMKKTQVSEEAKGVQSQISAKRKAERDFGKGKGKTKEGEDIAGAPKAE